MTYRRLLRPLSALLALVAMPAVAHTKPLDAETCQRIKTDIQSLEQQGIRDLMAKGATTAKSLAAPQLEKIRTLMDLDGQARFRCGERSFVTLKEEPPEEPAEAGAAPAAIDNATPGITLPPGAQSVGPVVPPVKRRPPPPPAKAAAPATKEPAAPKAPASATPAKTAPAAPKAKAPAETAPAKAATAAETPAAPAPKPKAPPAKKVEKQKADDAYRPEAPAKTE